MKLWIAALRAASLRTVTSITSPATGNRDTNPLSPRVHLHPRTVVIASHAVSTARRYTCVVSATYVAALRRPSILKHATPARISSGTCSTAIKSCGLSRYCTSPISVSCPSTTSPYGSRQACAHWPRLAERPPHASLEKHCPEYDTHSAPCTKHSMSAASEAPVGWGAVLAAAATCGAVAALPVSASHQLGPPASSDGRVEWWSESV